MNKNKLKIFATKSRTQLISSIKERLEKLKIDEPQKLPQKFESGILIDDISFSEGAKFKQRDELIKAINQIGKEQLIEEIAYTWFNRLVAIYFMQVNGYLKYGFSIVPSASSVKLEPEIVTNIHKSSIPNLDKTKAIELSNAGKFNELYNYILLLVCNDLHTQLPFLFERLNDYSELLIPSDLLIEGSIIQNIARETDENDWKEVEVIGWLYQYYISDKKDELIKAKKKYKDKDIPAVTQLFTPDWIVRYMVQNSLGRYWVESKSDEKIKKGWDFYIDSRDPNYKEEVKKLENKTLSPEEITVLDPACGSGHILVYAFDVLYEMYKTSGYVEKDIPQLILTKNLFGLEIDQRAGQLAQLSLYLKARLHDEKIFEKVSHLNIVIIKDSKRINTEHIDILSNGDKKLREYCESFVEQFKDADVLGSIIKIRNYDQDLIDKALNNLTNSHSIFASVVKDVFPTLCEQARLMNTWFDILVANPPYMGAKYMNSKLGKYVKENYEEVKADLFSVFIERMLEWTKPEGHLGIMSPYVWMFIQAYEYLRRVLVDTKNISSLIQLEYNAFENACIPVCIFTLRNYMSDVSGEFVKLSEFTGFESQPIKLREAVIDIKSNYRFTIDTKEFKKISGMPISYWASEKVFNLFSSLPKISEDKLIEIAVGLQTGENEKFIRNWFEVNKIKTALDLPMGLVEHSKAKWFSYNKGGDFRKWYGNKQFVVDWENDGKNIREDKLGRLKRGEILESNSKPKNTHLYFKPSVSCSAISSTAQSYRFYEEGSIFDINFRSLFSINPGRMLFYLGLFNSKIIFFFSKLLSSTLAFSKEDLMRLPVKYDSEERIIQIVKELIAISKSDWDKSEISWNFKFNELAKSGNLDVLLKSQIDNYIEKWSNSFAKMFELENELNKILIDDYQINEQKDNLIKLEDITILQDEILERDEGTKTIQFDEQVLIKQFISYAVGCMVGRYSLDVEGLVYAGGEYDPGKYKTFKSDKDGIIPILVDDRFEDDITSRFKEFVKVVFGEKNYAPNIEYIANVLGRKDYETAIECIRRYFINDFYKDHVKMYKKRPIYWLYSSGKEKGFNAIVYMHRYRKETVSILRMDYLHKLQRSYDSDYELAEKQEKTTSDSREKIQFQKRMVYLKAILQELKKYDELLRHYADKQVEIDLDDGVVVNYAKFPELLVKIK